MTVRDHIRLNAPKGYLVLLRVFMGAFYLRVALGRALALQADPGMLKSRLAALEATTQFAWFERWLGWVVDPLRDSVFLPMLWVGAPLLLGLSLALGLFTRTGAALGALAVAHVWLLRFHSAGAPELMFLELQFATLAALAFAAAGRAYGIDAIFWKHRVLATHETGPDPRKAEPRVPIIKALPPIPLSESKPTGIFGGRPPEKNP